MIKDDKSAFLGTERIFPLLVKMALPAMAGMLVQALYNVVDTIFVGRGVGPLAIGALSIVFPIQVIVSSISMGMGVGAASIVSRRLGEGREDQAAAAIGTGYTAMAAGTLILMALLFFFMEPVLGFFGASEALMPYAVEYTRIIIPGLFFFSLSMIASTLIRAEGRAKTAMTGMIIGAVLNCILDPIFIFKLDLGVSGAAGATIISQIVSSVYFLIIYLRRMNTVRLRRSDFRINPSILRESSLLGVPAFVQSAGMSILALIVNNSLGYYGGDSAIINYGMAQKFITLMILPMLGISQGFQPVAGYNFGARYYDRVRQSLKVALLSGFTIIAIGYTIAMLFPEACMGLFSSDAGIRESAAGVIRLMILTIPLASVQFIGTAYFQAVGKAGQAMALGLSRQFIILIPLVLLLPMIIGLDGIWLSYPAADLVSSVLTGILLFFEARKLNKYGEPFNSIRSSV